MNDHTTIQLSLGQTGSPYKCGQANSFFILLETDLQGPHIGRSSCGTHLIIVSPLDTRDGPELINISFFPLT